MCSREPGKDLPFTLGKMASHWKKAEESTAWSLLPSSGMKATSISRLALAQRSFGGAKEIVLDSPTRSPEVEAHWMVLGHVPVPESITMCVGGGGALIG